MPYEPGRPAFASFGRTMDALASLADGRIEELPPRFDEIAAPALAYLERTLFSEQSPASAPPIDGALRFFEAAGTRGVLELVGEELLALIRSGVAPEEIGLVCPTLDRLQAPLETALATLGVPYALESYVRLDKTAYGQVLLSLLRFAWLGGTRADLYAFLRSPYSALGRQNVDFLEGRLRGRAVDKPEQVEEETIRLRDGQPLRMLEERSRARLIRPDQVARDRYLFYTACTRATQRVYLVREAAGDDGSPREPSPFWDEVRALFPRDDVGRWTRRRPLSQLTWPLESAPTERERLRAVALRAAEDRPVAEAIASANEWERRLARALHAFERPTR